MAGDGSDLDPDHDAAARAAELAERALQDALLALNRARAAPSLPDELDELERAVARARKMVEAAMTAASGARALTERAAEALTASRARSRVAGPLPSLTWGRRRAVCDSCQRAFVVRFRCSVHVPEAFVEVTCHFTDCNRPVRVKLPESAYASATRAEERR